MSLSIDSLRSSLTSDQVKAKLYEIADSLGLATTAWQRLSPLRTIFAIISQVYSGMTQIQAVINASGLLDFAEDNLLTALALYVYGVTRNLATFAKGDVTIDNSGGGLYTFAPGDLVVLNSTTGKTYANTASVTINPLETGVVVEVSAVELGSDSNAAPGQIDSFSSASPSLSVTNALAFAGEDEESDAELRVSCRDSLAALSPNGPADAYRYVATKFTLNGGVDCNRVRVLPPPGDGTVTVVVAGPDGALSAPDLATVDAKLQALVVREIDTEYTVNATEISTSDTFDVYISTAAGLLDADVEALVQDAVVEFYSALPIGGDLLQGGPDSGVSWRALEGVARASNQYILQAKLTVEADLVMGETEIAVPSAITVIVHQVST